MRAAFAMLVLAPGCLLVAPTPESARCEIDDVVCPGGFTCDDVFGGCLDSCGGDEDCRPAFHCCDWDYDYAQCDLGTCVADPMSALDGPVQKLRR